MKLKTRVLSLLLAVTLTAGLSAPALAALPDEYYLKTTATIEGGLHSGSKTELSKGFVIASRVFQGDQNGALNWDDTLTRAEAVTMLIRLMGLDGEAPAAAARPCPFSDVPDWARGYVTLAAEKGVTIGMGDGRFDPSSPCGAREFITMLYRLTHLTEGKDYSWATALDDFIAGVSDLSSYRGGGWSLPFATENFASGLDLWFKHDGPFTREITADVIYLMLSFNAGPQGESLGDILAAEYGMSDLLLYDHYVRRTGCGMPRTASLTFGNLASDSKDVTLSVQNGQLTVDDSRGGDMTVELPDGDRVSLSGPVTLPKESFRSTLSYKNRFLAGYDEDGDPLYGGKSYSQKFTVTYQDGTWSLSKWGDEDVDYAYIYAYQSEEHWEKLRKQDWGQEITPEIQALADRLTAGKETELEKADALCHWVATHIYYDYADLRAPYDKFEEVSYHQLAGVVLERRRAICAGYSNLTLALFRAAGLECYDESGRGANAAHGWNVARLDGKWVVIDNTWDSALTYEKIEGEGYQCSYSDPSLIFVVRAPENYLEPGAERSVFATYFNMDHDRFYQNHTLEREPVYGSKTVLNVNHVLPK